MNPLFVRLGLHSKEFTDGMRRAQSELTSMNNHTKNISRGMQALKSVAVAAFAGWGISRVIGEFKNIIQLSIAQEAAEQKLAAVIKSTAAAAGFAQKELIDYAKSLQAMTTFGDEVIIDAEAMLATFTNIKGVQFKETITSALDLSTVMKQDLKSSVVQLGKALNDPIANLGALGRTGIQFSKEQKDTIKSLWEMGQAADAQNVIIKELQRQFGGAASAMKNTFGGALESVKNSFGDFLEQVGNVIIKDEEFIQILHDVEATLANKQSIEEFTETLRDMALVIKGMIDLFGLLYQAIKLVADAFDVFDIGIGDFFKNLRTLKESWGNVIDVITGKKKWTTGEIKKQAEEGSQAEQKAQNEVLENDRKVIRERYNFFRDFFKTKQQMIIENQAFELQSLKHYNIQLASAQQDFYNKQQKKLPGGIMLTDYAPEQIKKSNVNQHEEWRLNRTPEDLIGGYDKFAEIKEKFGYTLDDAFDDYSEWQKRIDAKTKEIVDQYNARMKNLDPWSADRMTLEDFKNEHDIHLDDIQKRYQEYVEFQSKLDPWAANRMNLEDFSNENEMYLDNLEKKQREFLEKQKDLKEHANLLADARVDVNYKDLWLVQAEDRADVNSRALDAIAEQEKQFSSFMIEISQHTANSMQDAFSDFFFDAMRGKLNSLGDYVNSFIESVQRSIAQIAAQQLVTSAIGYFGASVGSYAKGGYAYAGETAWVGERGPELVRFGSNVHITPTEKLDVKKFADGGYAYAGETAWVGERGLELIRYGSNSENSNKMYYSERSNGDVIVNVNNNSNNKVDVQKKTKSDGTREILIAIGRDIENNGITGQAIQRRFGLAPSMRQP